MLSKLSKMDFVNILRSSRRVPVKEEQEQQQQQQQHNNNTNNNTDKYINNLNTYLV